MREIKFRVWDKEEKIMFDPEKHPDYSFEDFIIQTRPNDLKPEYRTDRYVVMQYAGLKDKNGREIYESDTCWAKLQYRPFNIIKGYVIFYEGEWMLQEREQPDGTVGNCHGLYKLNDLEVIGNVFENPELLEAK